MATQRTPVDWTRHALVTRPLVSQEMRSVVDRALGLISALKDRCWRASAALAQRLHPFSHLAGRRWQSWLRDTPLHPAFRRVRRAFSLSPGSVDARSALAKARPPRFGTSPPPRFPLAPIPGGRYERRLLDSQAHLLKNFDATDDEPTTIHAFIAPHARVIQEERA